MKNWILILFVCFASICAAQSTYRSVKRGNNEVENQNYSEAEVYYRKALDTDSKAEIPRYNLGNTQYLQERYDEAVEQFKLNVEAFESKQDQADAYHNWGNALLEQKKYEESIDAYKEALKRVPTDMDTKYNLAYAQEMLRKEQQQQQQEQQDQENQEEQEEENKEEQDQNGDENEQEKEGSEKDGEEKEEEKNPKEEEGEGDEEKKDENGDKEEEEQEKEKPATPKEAKLTKEQAEQLLQMLENQEGKLQEKLDEPEGDPVKIYIEKDW